MTVPRVLLHGGFYDFGRRAEFADELRAIEPQSDVVLDLSATEFIDCGGLGLLVTRLSEWREQKPGTNVRLTNVSASLAKVLALLRLDEVFIVETP